MKTKWKLFAGFFLVSIISAGVAVGTYGYLNSADGQVEEASALFNQGNYRAVGLAVAAEQTDFTSAAEQTVNGVVHIKSIATPSQRNSGRRYFDPFEFFFGQTPQFQAQPQVGFGSGVIISTDGYIVTNNHVIRGADEIEVTTNNNETHKARLIGGDESTDIALLKIDGKKEFSVVPFGDSETLKVGEWVLAVGNPFNLTSTVTAGIVSAKGRGNLGGMRTQDKVQSYIQTDAAVNPGNSGGALVNTRGELVGINTMIYSETGNFVGYSFAVPVNIVKKVVTDIKQYGVVQRAMLGVSVLELSDLKKEYPEKYDKLSVKEGVYVAEFSSNSSAEKAGIKEGDVITAINGHKINNFAELRAQISLFNPGDKVDVKVQRGDKEQTIKVELKNDQGTTEAIKIQRFDELLGASFKELTQEMKRKAGINYGLEVSGIKDGKLKQIGIKNGFIILTVNDKRLSDPADLERIVNQVLKEDPDNRGLFIKGFYPSGRVEYYAVDLNG